MPVELKGSCHCGAVKFTVQSGSAVPYQVSSPFNSDFDFHLVGLGTSCLFVAFSSFPGASFSRVWRQSLELGDPCAFPHIHPRSTIRHIDHAPCGWHVHLASWWIVRLFDCSWIRDWWTFNTTPFLSYLVFDSASLLFPFVWWLSNVFAGIFSISSVYVPSVEKSAVSGDPSISVVIMIHSRSKVQRTWG